MTAASLSLFAIPGIPLITDSDDLCTIIETAVVESGHPLLDGDVLVVAQKIVSKAEGRTVNLGSVTPSAQAETIAKAADKDPRLVELMLAESSKVLRSKPGVVIVEHKLGYVLANAGIDRSNVNGDDDEVLLLPIDPDKSANEIRRTLRDRLGVSIGVVIADSVGRAWRMGTIGMALGSSGIVALENLRGETDMFGRELEVSEHAVADAVAAAAELVMGEAGEATPVVLVRGLSAGDSEQDATALLRPPDEDLFR